MPENRPNWLHSESMCNSGWEFYFFVGKSTHFAQWRVQNCSRQTPHSETQNEPRIRLFTRKKNCEEIPFYCQFILTSNIKIPGYVVTYQLLSPLIPNGPESNWHITQQIHSPSCRAKAQFTPHLITTYSVDTTCLTVEGKQTVAAVSDLRQTKVMGEKEITILRRSHGTT